MNKTSEDARIEIKCARVWVELVCQGSEGDGCGLE